MLESTTHGDNLLKRSTTIMEKKGYDYDDVLVMRGLLRRDI